MPTTLVQLHPICASRPLACAAAQINLMQMPATHQINHLHSNTKDLLNCLSSSACVAGFHIHDFVHKEAWDCVVRATYK